MAGGCRLCLRACPPQLRLGLGYKLRAMASRLRFDVCASVSSALLHPLPSNMLCALSVQQGAPCLGPTTLTVSSTATNEQPVGWVLLWIKPQQGAACKKRPAAAACCDAGLAAAVALAAAAGSAACTSVVRS